MEELFSTSVLVVIVECNEKVVVLINVVIRVVVDHGGSIVDEETVNEFIVVIAIGVESVYVALT